MDAFIVKIPCQLLAAGVVTTPAPPPPSSASPAVTINSPGSDATVSGTVAVSAVVTDSQSITSLTFELDGGVREMTLNQAPYSVSWNTGDTTPGKHVITAVAVDSAGNSSVSPPVTVTEAGAQPNNGGGTGGIGSGGLPSGGNSSPSDGGGNFDCLVLLALWVMWCLRLKPLLRRDQLARHPL